MRKTCTKIRHIFFDQSLSKSCFVVTLPLYDFTQLRYRNLCDLVAKVAMKKTNITKLTRIQENGYRLVCCEHIWGCWKPTKKDLCAILNMLNSAFFSRNVAGFNEETAKNMERNCGRKRASVTRSSNNNEKKGGPKNERARYWLSSDTAWTKWGTHRILLNFFAVIQRSSW